MFPTDARTIGMAASELEKEVATLARAGEDCPSLGLSLTLRTEEAKARRDEQRQLKADYFLQVAAESGLSGTQFCLLEPT